MDWVMLMVQSELLLELDIKRRPPDNHERCKNDIIFRRNVELKDAGSKSGGKLRA
jgi:hypothetical protein